MGEILLIRHGETAWNREEVFRGRADVPLSDRGREQARLLARAMMGRSVEAVYSSPLARARETAEPMARALGLEVALDRRLVDMSFGEWEGKARSAVEQMWPELYEIWMREPGRFRAPGGESLAEVLARAWPALEEIAGRHEENSAAIVSHRVVCKVLLCEGLGAGAAGFWRVRVDTGSASVLERTRDGWVVTRVNDTRHLRVLGEGDRADF
jgi:broad specificity phosphatase PhoE